MSRVLFVYERDMPTVSGLIDSFSGLAERYDSLSVRHSAVADLTPAAVDENDVIVFIRPNDLLSAAISGLAHQTGRTVITFCDDDLLSHQPEPPWRLKALRATLANSDIIWSSSRHICEKYMDLTCGKRMSVIDTMVRPEQITERVRKADGERIKFVYATNPAHVKLFDEFVRPVFGDFISRFGDKVSFTFVGVRPDLKEFEDKTVIRYVNSMGLNEYRAYMASERFDVGIAPLEDNEFTHCKYYNKYIEYSMVGAMGIYSDIIPYVYAVRDRDNGLLAANTDKGWLDAMTEAVLEPELIERTVASAQEDLKNVYTEKNIFARTCADIPELMADPGEYAQCRGFSPTKIRYSSFRLLDWAYLSAYYIRHGAFTQKLKAHFRDRNAYKRR